MKYSYGKNDLILAVKNSKSIAGVCRELNIKPAGGNYKTLKNKFNEHNIDISHFTGKGWNQGDNFRVFGKRKILSEILIKDSTYTNTSRLKDKLIKEGLKENKCEICGINEWVGKKITCELDHINGINNDNRIENLRILCPNCHSQTPTFRRRNTNTVTKKYNHGNGLMKKDLPKCKHCGKKCEKINRKYCSKECQYLDNSINIPKVPEILEMFKKHKTFVRVGKEFNVSDNAVRKWCIKYGIIDMINKNE